MFGPLARGALAPVRTNEADIERPARRAASVADEPIAALPAAGAQVMPAHGFDVAGKPARNLAGGEKTGHCNAPSSGGVAVGDADDHVALDQARKHLSSRVADRNKEPQFPGDDLAEEAKRAQAIAHALGEAA